MVEIPLDELADKIQGGLLGQILGNLNGLPHEMKYIAEPGDVKEYTPLLPEGARTDDDTDLEWMYIIEMQRSGKTFIPPGRILELWIRHVNDHIWCANLYARRLMDIGLKPPLTGRLGLNPWSEFNISGQFVAEAFGLIAPAMPQTAARIGLHYTHVTIDGEPAQATQFFTGMIAAAFVRQDVKGIVLAGLKNVDPRSTIAQVVGDVRRWHSEHPDDWRSTRRLIRDRYTRCGGVTRDGNGHELNTAAVVGALLYGGGDFRETLRLAFNFGWDADCNAATAGTVVGVVRGRHWMDQQGWTINDRYRNTTRPGLPEDETISGYGRRLVGVARRVIEEQGGREILLDGRTVLRIVGEQPGVVEPLAAITNRKEELRRDLGARLESGLSSERRQRAGAAYLALCLGEADRLRRDRPEDWAASEKALQSFPALLKSMANIPRCCGESLREAGQSAGLIPATSAGAP